MALLNNTKILNIKRLRAQESDEKKRAQLRNIFYSQDNMSINEILREDLQNFMDAYDISKLRYVTLDDFVKTFLAKISLVHKSPLILKFDNSIKPEQQDRLRKILDEVEIHRVLQDTEMRMKLHNTILVRAAYFNRLDKLYIDNSFDAESTRIEGFDGFESEEKLVIRKRTNKFEEEEWLIWDRNNNTFYRTVEDPKYDANYEDIVSPKLDTYFDIAYTDEKSPYPFVKYRASDQNYGFWGNGMDSLVELVRTVNILLTILADDTISETMRILLLNFIPLGIDGKPGDFKVGMRNPIIGQPRAGEEITAEVISADLYTDDIIKFVDKLVDSVSSMHGIDNVLTKEIKADISGVAIRLRNEHLIRSWQKDIDIIRKYDKQLIEKLIEVNNFNRPGFKIDPKIVEGITLDYQTPEYFTNEMEDYTLERLKWQDGTSSPLLWVLRRNPEMTEEQARKFIDDNLQNVNEVKGIGALPEIQPEEITAIVGQ